MTETVEYYRYVRFADVARFESAGWIKDADLGPLHGQFAILMRWAGEGAPQEP